MALAVACYWVGLQGPFLFDDTPVIGAVKSWLEGRATLGDVVLGDRSIVLSRALSMASFTAAAGMFGHDPFWFKLTNLCLHLATGLAAYLFLTQLLTRDAQLRRHARTVAAMVAAIWLLHPLHASTVLYAVQQMAQWPALICLLGLGLYTRTRLQMLAGRSSGRHLWLTIPALSALAILGKQNGAVLPLLCLVIELGYFERDVRVWPTSIKALFIALVAAPSAVLLAGLVLTPEHLLSGYAAYEFSPWQRLISQTRVLWDYVAQLLAPHSPSMGVFKDGFPASTGLLEPASTLLATLALCATSLLAIAVRNRLPGLFTGWFFFLAAHVVESSILPIELYYEHRNYLPAIGVLMAAASICAGAGAALSRKGIRVGRLAPILTFGLLAMLAFQTHGRARVWSDAFVLYESELRSHPDSSYALISYAGTASMAGDTRRAYAVLDNVIANPPSRRLHSQALLFRAHLDCVNQHDTPPARVMEAIATLPNHVDTTTFNVLNLLSSSVGDGDCGRLDKSALATAYSAAAEQATRQPPGFIFLFALRNHAAKLYAEEGMWAESLAQAKLGWQPGTPAPAAVHLIEALLVNGQPNEASIVIADALSRAGDEETRARLNSLQEKSALELAAPGRTRREVESLQAMKPLQPPIGTQ